MASKMLAIELWVVRQFNLEIFCLNVYGDNDETMILYQWNELQWGHSNHEHLGPVHMEVEDLRQVRSPALVG